MAHLRNLGTQVVVLMWALQEGDELQNIKFGLLTPGNITKTDTGVVFNYPGFGFTYAEEASPPHTAKPFCRWSQPCCKK